MKIGINYNNLANKITIELKNAFRKLKEMDYESEPISPREFYDYMTGETPTGDTITILDVLDNEFLMIHEAVEISELKKHRIPINTQTVMKVHPRVYENHFKATEYELTYALNTKHYEWIRLRMAHAKSWLEDPNLSPSLARKCQALIEKFSKA